ncbi:carboxylate-amine ligase [Nocardiopsis suaedae]|uniref:Putative glutamate--cysteine ligase 2 n=1 Tax=Nocardiopsis suaedae TaxID=3018444 RepID=A0ABT4TK21_9ACTN|nr:glutamate--cysteine ligase [Nocardiopsis suaedae]MDA2805019.1 glutamate--cysteine ligase [Nocardiopsis suaedae]
MSHTDRTPQTPTSGGAAALPGPQPPVPATVPTFGQEEEFFVVDPDSRLVAPRAGDVLEAVRARFADRPESGARLGVEMTRFQVEASGPVCRTAEEMARGLAGARAELGDAAADRGLAVAATGTAVLGDVAAAPLTQGPRYRAIADEFGALRDSHAVCGCHVHVGARGTAAALEAVNRLRPWLPALLALTANSPFQRGRDTGHASWRRVSWGWLPSAGPPPPMDSPAQYGRAVQELTASGAALDRRMVYWDVRPAPELPTVEVRVGDVAATAEEAVLAAVLVRGLAGVPAPSPGPADRPLRLALWRAARDGLEGEAYDPATGDSEPARAAVERMFAHAEPALAAAGEAASAAALLERVVAAGSGARRQRAAYARRGRLSDVVDLLVRQTRYGLAATEK